MMVKADNFVPLQPEALNPQTAINPKSGGALNPGRSAGAFNSVTAMWAFVKLPQKSNTCYKRSVYGERERETERERDTKREREM